jgi:hypothetical protein
MSQWRDILPIHPAAEMLPSISENELKELGDDIKENGLRNKVTIFEGQLLDGRSRLDAMESVKMPVIEDGKIDPKLVDHVEGIDPNAYVLSLNLHRRHLTSKQKRELIDKLLRENPQASDRKIGRMAKADHKTVNEARKDGEARGEIPHLEKRTDSKGRKQPAKKKSGTKTKRDAALDYFIEHVADLLQEISNHKPEHFAKTGVKPDDLKKLGDFFHALADLTEQP